MKRVLIAHYNGSWFNEKTILEYEQQISVLIKILKKFGVIVERFAHMPSDEEVDGFDAVVTISISFKRDAKKIRQNTGKKVFIVTGIIERGDDAFGVIPIEKSIGLHMVAVKILEELSVLFGFMIRTSANSASERDDMFQWRPLPEELHSIMGNFFKENPAVPIILRHGGIVTIDRLNKKLTQEIMRLDVLKCRWT